MAVPLDDKPVRKHLNVAEKRALKAADVQRFVQEYGRQSRARGGFDPNDRGYDRELEQKLRSMSPEELDRLMREDEE